MVAKKKTDAAGELVALVGRFTQADLDELDRQITSRQQAIDAQLAEARKDVDALKAARRVVSMKLNGHALRGKKKGSKKTKEKPAAGPVEAIAGLSAKKQIELVLRRDGALSLAGIASALPDVPYGTLSGTLSGNPDLFRKTGNSLWVRRD